MRALQLVIAVAIALVANRPRAVADHGSKSVPIAVIVGKDSKVTKLSSSDLKRVFTGDTVSAGGGRLVPFNHNPSTAPRVGFDRVVLGMTADEVGRFWVDRKVRGQTGAPRTLAGSSQVVKVVAKFPNAIGYVPLADVTADVKVIAIDGAVPDGDGYAIWTSKP